MVLWNHFVVNVGTQHVKFLDYWMSPSQAAVSGVAAGGQWSHSEKSNATEIRAAH